MQGDSENEASSLTLCMKAATSSTFDNTNNRISIQTHLTPRPIYLPNTMIPPWPYCFYPPPPIPYTPHPSLLPPPPGFMAHHPYMTHAPPLYTAYPAISPQRISSTTTSLPPPPQTSSKTGHGGNVIPLDRHDTERRERSCKPDTSMHYADPDEGRSSRKGEKRMRDRSRSPYRSGRRAKDRREMVVSRGRYDGHDRQSSNSNSSTRRHYRSDSRVRSRGEPGTRGDGGDEDGEVEVRSRYSLMSDLNAFNHDDEYDDGGAIDMKVKHTLPRIPKQYRRDYLETIAPTTTTITPLLPSATVPTNQPSNKSSKCSLIDHREGYAMPLSHCPVSPDQALSLLPSNESHLEQPASRHDGAEVVTLEHETPQIDTTTPLLIKSPSIKGFNNSAPVVDQNEGGARVDESLIVEKGEGYAATLEAEPEVMMGEGEEDSSEDEIIEEEENDVDRVEDYSKADGEEENKLQDSELFDMLEEPVDNAGAPLVYKKSVLRAPDRDDFEVLPESWIEVTHLSGIPVYLHRGTRVCTLARPYFLGSSSVRKHSVPLGSVPCFNYLKWKERKGIIPNHKPEQCKEEEISPPTPTEPGCADMQTPSAPDALMMPSTSASAAAVAAAYDAVAPLLLHPEKFKVSVESAQQVASKNWLSPSQVREYCERRFDFHTITVRKFKRWADRRKQIKKLKCNRPSLPKSAQIVKCTLPVRRLNGQIVAKKKNFYFNPEDKTVLCVLHEYVQNVLKTQVQYTFHTVENTKLPFCSKLSIKGVEYGVGYGANKKLAKLEAARAALSVLNPEIADIYNKSGREKGGGDEGAATLDSTCVKLFPNQALPSIGFKAATRPLLRVDACKHGCTREKDGVSNVAAAATPTPSPLLSPAPAPQKLPEKDDASPLKSCKPVQSGVSKEVVTAKHHDSHHYNNNNKVVEEEDEEFDIFNELKVTDPRIAELSIKAGQSLPYAILLECMKRNFGLTDSNVQSELKTMKPSKHVFTLTVGKHTATVTCSNKREGKHKAAQQIIQDIHPQVTNWGSILRLYGRNYTKDLLGRKMEQNSITSLQTQAKMEGPNINILNKLRADMTKLYERRKLLFQPNPAAASTIKGESLEPKEFRKITDLNI